MSIGVSMEELLGWSEESSNFWKAHLDANPALLELKCGIGGATNVQQLVRHIWGAEMRWARRLASEPEISWETMPPGPLEALFDLHLQATGIFKRLLANPQKDWEARYTLNFDWLPPDKRALTHRKILGHALLHGQRHWAQLATLVREAGSPSGFWGDLLFSSSLA
jgi:uncharacterized damage-inducible protein DinB